MGPMLGQAHQYLYYNKGKSVFAEKKSKKYVKHVYEIIEKQLTKHKYFADQYSIADIAIWPWVDRHERHQVKLIHFQGLQLKILR